MWVCDDCNGVYFNKKAEQQYFKKDGTVLEFGKIIIECEDCRAKAEVISEIATWELDGGDYDNDEEMLKEFEERYKK